MKVRKYLVLYSALVSTFFYGINEKHCISHVAYTLSYGRFGDQLLAFAIAQYISHVHNIPWLYTSFKGSDLLKLHYEKNISYEKYKKITSSIKHVEIDQKTVINQSHNVEPIVYVVSIGTRYKDIKGLDSIGIYALDDSIYRLKIQNLFTPTCPIYRLTWPPNHITVALHVRKPSGYDTPLSSIQYYNPKKYVHIKPTIIEKKNNGMLSDKRYPHKFPPNQYYMDQLNLLADIFADQSLYVYLFTDYKNPQELVDLYAPHLKKNITLVCHSPEQQKYMRFIDDYYNMAQANCLIRASSNFSRAAQLLGNHQLVIYPKSTHWYDDAVIVDKVQLLGVTKNYDEYKFALYDTFTETIDDKTFIQFIQSIIKKTVNPQLQSQHLST